MLRNALNATLTPRRALSKRSTEIEMPTELRKKYRHGNVPGALCRAARQILDASDIEDVGLRKVARLAGVSAAAAYRHFESWEEVLAAVAAEGFSELTAALRASADEPDPAIAVGLAYVDFALTKRGVFRLMFGPILLQKEKYPTLNNAVAEAREAVGLSGAIGNEYQPLAAWALYHGLSALFIGNLPPEANVRALAQRILAEAF